MFLRNVLSSTAMGVIILIVGIFTVLLLLAILGNICTLVDNKGRYYKSQTDQIVTEPVPNESTAERLDAANKLYELIATMAEVEVNDTLFQNMVLRVPYEIVRLDTDVQAISTRIYDGIRKEFMVNINNIFTDQYIMSVIAKFVATTMINKTGEINRSIREEKMTQ